MPQKEESKQNRKKKKATTKRTFLEYLILSSVNLL